MELAVLRDDMVDSLEHEAKRVVRSDRLSIAMREVPRHEFVEDDRGAYADTSHQRLGTRVLAPSDAARLLEALDVEPDHSVLIVGAGVGYTAAVAAEIAGARNVHAIDITRSLVLEARHNLAKAGYGEVLVDRRDGADGLAEYAPYDRILLEAAAIQPPDALREQLAEDGRLVMPRGASEQTLTAFDADGGAEELGGVAFAPLLVEGEQIDAVERNRTAREDREHARREAQSRHGWQRDWIDWDDR
ncbi:protein-L-isoaspartate(D-aspartate) O-methyltransferase [Natronoarchaeum philippinense]|uniref:protein-L-isoaspartate(D-aspartate) O-methyltransferase n=1 Tax=Natronoarchaeum philippinense TaxID=558529 RepID=A0A285NBA8_NATPI|nr:methyltransferase domain-containing protein [Natronoarchaeum philippinense]SNZ06745.1 protein-L-isoaspartate(D-aspartate) O-methyltransferase [Natronoarchaeum philippinense]